MRRNSSTRRALAAAAAIALATSVAPPTAPQSVTQGPAGSRQAIDPVPLPPPPPPVLDPHAALVPASSISITGTATGAEAVEVAGPQGVFQVPVRGGFAAVVPLAPDVVNAIWFTAIGPYGARSAPTATAVTWDTQPPAVTVDFPPDGATLATATTDVSGRVGDKLAGFLGLTVTVNGVAAIVDVGIGTNGTFYASGVPLTPGGPTVIDAVATDALGNAGSAQITVLQADPSGPQMAATSGGGQSGPVGTVLAQPIAVTVTEDGSTPFAGKLVTFRVDKSDGRLSVDGQAPWSTSVQVKTDAAGLARASWRLGSDAGCGNNRVEATSQSIAGLVFFAASATAGAPIQINVGSGDGQRVEAGATAPEPLRVWVGDGCNGVAGVPVTFTVTQGGGAVEGQSQVSVSTDATGHAQVDFTLGPAGGNQRVVADFAGNAGASAVFVARGVVRDPAAPTRFTGLVLDNANRPIGGAACTLVVGGAPLPVVQSDAAGLFAIEDVPVGGPGDLFVDGSVADLLDGQAIPTGTFPSLHYLVVVVPNADNALPTAVLLPPLNPANAVAFDNTQDVVLGVEEIGGLELVVRAGSMTRADGSVPDPGDPEVLSLDQVHFEDVPMPMPDGVSPPFAWTLQPGGATFDPPVEVRMPNMVGLPAGAVSYFLSFDHDTNRFEIVASGSVTPDGSRIVSDPGSGITKAGWGGICPPYTPPGTVSSCAVQITSPLEPLCVGQDFTFTAGGVPGGGTYAWSGGGLPASGAGAAFTTQFLAPGTYAVSVTYTCPAGGQDTAVAVVDVFDVTAELNQSPTDLDDFVAVTDPATPNRPSTSLTLTLDGPVPLPVFLVSAGNGLVSFSDPAPTLLPNTPLIVEVWGESASLAEDGTLIDVVPVGGSQPCVREDATVVTGVKVRFGGTFHFMVENNNGFRTSDIGPAIACNGDPDPLVWGATPLPCEGLDSFFYRVYVEEGAAGAERWPLASGVRPAIGVVVTGVKTFGPEVDLDGRDANLTSGTVVRPLPGQNDAIGFMITDDCDSCPSSGNPEGQEDGAETLFNFGLRFGDSFGLSYRDLAPTTMARIWTAFPVPDPNDEATDMNDIATVFFPGASVGCVEPSEEYFDENMAFQCAAPLSLKQLFLNNAGLRTMVRRAWANWTSRQLDVNPEAQFTSSFVARLFDGVLRGSPQNVNGDPSDDVWAEGFLQLTDYDWYTHVGQVSKGVASTPGGIDSSYKEWVQIPANPPSVSCDGSPVLDNCPPAGGPDVGQTQDPWN